MTGLLMTLLASGAALAVVVLLLVALLVGRPSRAPRPVSPALRRPVPRSPGSPGRPR